MFNSKFKQSFIALILASSTAFLHLIAVECKFNIYTLIYQSNNLVYFIYAIMLYFVYKNMFKLKYRHANMLNFISMLFSALSLVLFLYNSNLTLSFLLTSPIKITFLIICLFVNFFLFKSLSLHLLVAIDSFAISSDKLNWPQHKYMTILLLMWLPYYICMFPGTIQWDSGTMMEISYGLKPLSNNNPFLQIVILYCLTRFGDLINSDTVALATMSMLQLLTLAYLFSSVLKRMDMLKINKNANCIALLFLGFMPVFPNYAMSLGKDILFGAALLFLMLHLFDIIVWPESFKLNNAVKFFVAIILVCMLRNAGMYLVIFALLPIIIYLFFKHKNLALKVLLPSIIAITLNLLYVNALLPAWGVSKEVKTANISIPLQQVARTLSIHGTEALTDFEADSISKIINLDNAKKAYDPNISDRVKDMYNLNASNGEVRNFKKAWLSLGKRYPKTYIEATVYNSLGYFVPGIDSPSKPKYFWEYLYIENLKGKFEPCPHSKLMNVAKTATSLISRVPPFGILLTTGFIQTFHLFALLIVLASKRYKYIFIILPCVFYGLGLIASPVNAYYRYTIPVLLCLPLSFGTILLALKEEMIFKNNKNT